MRTALLVVSDERRHDVIEVLFAKNDEMIEGLALRNLDEPFRVSVRIRRLWNNFFHVDFTILEDLQKGPR